MEPALGRQVAAERRSPLPDPLALCRAIEAGELLDDHLWMLIDSVNHRMAAISRRVR